MDFETIAKRIRKNLVLEYDDYRIQYCAADYLTAQTEEFVKLGESLKQYYGNVSFGDVGSGLGLFKYANPDMDIYNWDMLKRDAFYNENQVTEVQGWYGDYTIDDFYIFMDPIPKQDVLVVSRALELSMYKDIPTFKLVMKNLSNLCNDEIVIAQQHNPGRPNEVKSFLQQNTTLLMNHNEYVLVCSFGIDTISRW
tara:strand:+ start:2404 stop:2991 length:588 start_codon:yes stop_codon:yes gene_type:complete